MKGRKKQAQAYERHFYPIPRIEVGLYLREHELASSMIDLSDGLSTDLAHICDESGVGAEVDATLLPLASVGKQRTEVDLEQALHGGEDYELLFTARERDIPSHIAGVPVTRIGEITQGTRAYLRTGKTRRRLPIRGWEHFSRK
jgi:thiamine-monophosphate kinase